MALERLQVLSRDPYEDGRRFGRTGAYERIEAVAHYAVDPEHAANREIRDLVRAPRDGDGRVRFRGDVTLLLPADPAAGNGSLLLQVPNRGRRQLARFNMTELDTALSAAVPPGDGHLFAHGWSIAWAGWQWDVPRTEGRERVGLEAPLLAAAARGADLPMQLRLQPDADTPSLALTDQHVGDLGRHRSIESRAGDDPDAVLTVRDGPYGEAETVPRSAWRFARSDNGAPVEDAGHVWLDGGFRAGRIYDLYYVPRRCPVAGAGLLAVRDCASFLRHDPSAPTAGAIAHVFGEGQSQCGRFLRTLLYWGLNRDEDGAPVFDGVLAHIAGGRRGEFNHRHAQPSVQPTPSFGHLFPFTDTAQRDPASGRREGLLDRVRAAGAMPKLIYTDTASEYWRGDAALTHTDLETGADVEPPEAVRRYLFAGTQHGPGAPPLRDRTLFGSRGGNAINMLDYRPLYRAALANLRAWVVDGEAPPPSAFPRAADDSRTSRAEALAQLDALPSLALPTPDAMIRMQPLDLGPQAEDGLAVLPARATGPDYPDLVAALDADGNERAGLRMPDLMVPVATHTGFNPRHPHTGGAGQMLEYIGSTLPFAASRSARERAGDPRPSLAERYAGRGDYLRQVEEAIQALVEARVLLAEDIALCRRIAAQRYDAVIEAPAFRSAVG